MRAAFHKRHHAAMKIVVCIKQVPDSANIRINPETRTLMREGAAAIVNPFDMYAIEAALQIRDKVGGTVTALSMGPKQAESALREALERGVNDAVLLCDRAFAGSDTYATSYVLSQAIRKIGGVDVVVFGRQASDGDTAQVGPGVATHLDLPQITYAGRLVEITPESITAERLLEDGRETLRASVPCVLTVVREIGEPRLPSLRGKMAAKRAEIPVWTAADIGAEPDNCGLKGSPTKVVKAFTPEPRAGGEIFDGDPEAAVAALVERLQPILSNR